MSNFEVEFYTLPNGKKPAKEFIENLEVKMKAQVLRSINLLQDNGYSLREPYSKKLKDKSLKLEYDSLDIEFSIIQALIDARKNSGLTQKDLAAKTGIAQADISRLENGNGNPSLKTLQRLAKGLGMKLIVQFKSIA